MEKYIIIMMLLCLSCATVDYEKTTKVDTTKVLTQTTDKKEKPLTEEERKQKELELMIEETVMDIRPEIVFIERPVYIPERSAQAAQTAGRSSVQTSTTKGTIKPSAYSQAARIYDYHPDQVYEIYTQTLRMTDIYLEEGEIAVEAPYISDSERWMLGGGVSYNGERKTQHIYVKPTEINLQATMIINTDRRVYHILLRSYADVYMPIVRWQYKLNVNNLPQDFIKREELNEGIVPQKVNVSQQMEYVDPRYLSFDYRVMYGIFGRPKWLPRLVYDDGKKTYIVFEDHVLQTELPAVFENRNDIVNYRVQGNLIVIDKLIVKISLKREKEKITIAKKK